MNHPLPPYPQLNLQLPSFDGQIDLGTLVQAANGSWARVSTLVTKLTDDRKKQYLSFHCASDCLHSHSVTKMRSWNVSFQFKWLDQFLWLSYSPLLYGGTCRYCILSHRWAGTGQVFYSSPYSKALGKDGILVYHNRAVMHCRAAGPLLTKS